jgi:hypothetical protein
MKQSFAFAKDLRRQKKKRGDFEMKRMIDHEGLKISTTKKIRRSKRRVERALKRSTQGRESFEPELIVSRSRIHGQPQCQVALKVGDPNAVWRITIPQTGS